MKRLSVLAITVVLALSHSLTAQDVVLRGTGNDAEDTATLQSAFNAAVVDGNVRLIELRGSFSVNRPLRMGGYTKLSGKGAAISYSYYAPITSEPMLTIAAMGAQRDAIGASVRSLDFYCNRRCRGIKFHTDTSTEILRDVRVDDAIEIAVDLVDCWASSVYGLTISGARGVSLRTARCNLGYYERVHILDGYLLHHKDSKRNVELWEYAHEHGLVATREEFGEECIEHWPQEVAPEDRAIIVLGTQQDLTRFVSLRFEPVACADLPAISCRATNTTFEQLYFEGGYFSKLPDTAMIHVHDCANTTFEQVRVTSILESPYLIRLSGRSTHTKLDGVYTYTTPHGLSQGIVREDPGVTATAVVRQAGYMVTPVKRGSDKP